MGLFDYFRRRRERESAVAGLDVGADPSQQVSSSASGGEASAKPADQQDLTAAIEAGGFDLAQLGQIGALITQAAREGNIQVHQGTPQEIDLRGTGLREEILGIMSTHGIDAEAGSGQQIDASEVPDMQEQILDALRQAGVDVPAGGEAGGIEIQGRTPDDQP